MGKSKSSWACWPMAVTAAMSLLAGSAMGQDAVRSEPQNKAATDGADVAQERGIEEIVVSATKRQEMIEDVPISMTVIGGDEVRDSGFDSLSDLTKMTPNVRLDSETKEVSIRGLGDRAGALVELSTALIVDGIYYGRDGYMWNAMADIDRFELLRGPQGTIFGKNASAGVISFTTGDPLQEWAGRLGGRFGEFEEQYFEGMVTGPIVEDLAAFRVAGVYFERDGYFYNTTLKEDVEWQDSWLARGKLKFDLSEKFWLKFMAESYEKKMSQAAFQLSKMSDRAQTVFPLFDPEVEDDEDDGRLSHDQRSTRDRDGETYTFHVGWEISDAINLYWNNGYSPSHDEWLLDADMSPMPTIELATSEDYYQASSEVRLVGAVGPLDYVGGLYYFRSDLENFNQVIIGNPEISDGVRLLTPDGLRSLAGPILDQFTDIDLPDGLFIRNDFTLDDEVYAGFGQVWWQATERLKFIIGARYMRETKNLDIKQTHTPYVVSAALAVNNGNVPPPSPNDLDPVGQEAVFLKKAALDQKNFSYTLAGNFALTDTIKTYLSYATAFKAGGFSAGDGKVYRPETAKSWEAGVKGKFFNNLMRLNLSAYRGTFDDLQVLIYTGSFIDGGNGFVANNAGGALVQGIEADAMLIPARGLILTATFAFNDTEFTEYKDAECPAESEADSCDLTGRTLPRAPRLNGSFHFNLSRPLGNLPMNYIIRGDAFYRSDYYLAADLDENTLQDEFWQFNAAIGLQHPDRVWRFVVQGFNLTETSVRKYMADVPLMAGSFAAYMEGPRRITASFTVEF